jgi:hypothetical protein
MMRALLVIAAMTLLPQLGMAGVYMCVDPVSGKKTFTDRACPQHGTGEKVKVQTTNFGGGIANEAAGGTWNSHRDTSRSGRHHVQAEREQSARGLAESGAADRDLAAH